jgi:hypothetical protein
MHIVVRKYEGCPDVAALHAGVEAHVRPTQAAMMGFHSYTLVDLGGGAVMSISMFDTRAHADASNYAVRALVQRHFPRLLPRAPVVLMGHVLGDAGLTAQDGERPLGA